MQSIELSIGGQDDDIALPEDAPEDEAKMNAKAQKSDSDSFQILINEEEEILQTDLILVPTISIKLNDFYEVVPAEQLKKIFESAEQWAEFTNKIAHSVSGTSPIQLIEINSLIALDRLSETRRTVWKGIIQNQPKPREEEINQQDHQASKREDRQYSNCQGNNQQFEVSLEQLSVHEKKFVKNIDKNVSRLMDKWPEYRKEKDGIQAHIARVISWYSLKDEQISNPKGLEYLLLAMIVASPFQNNLPQCSRAFNFFFNELRICKLYHSDEAVYYQQELPQLLNQLKTEAPKLYDKMEKWSPQWGILFTSYYKTLMMYKIKDIQLIAKLLDLLLIYGVRIIRIILCRILARKQNHILSLGYSKERLLSYMGTDIIKQHFNCLSAPQENGPEDDKPDRSQLIKLQFQKLIIGHRPVTPTTPSEEANSDNGKNVPE